MNRRWWIVWTLFFSTAINYINRQTLSVLAPVISKEFHLSHTQLSNMFGAFQFAYAGTWLLGGIFLDIIGTRLGLSIAVVWCHSTQWPESVESQRAWQKRSLRFVSSLTRCKCGQVR